MTSVTLNQELDSSFLKGLRLLHSSEPDAEEQLQQLWKQAVIDKYGSERTPTSILHKITVPSTLKRESSDTSDTTVEAKRSKLESSLLSKSSTPAPSQQTLSADVETNNASSNDDSNDSPLEILNGDGVCMKCKASTSPKNNKLVECVDCHKHYHQLCHFPPITDMDLSDPRFVWYCASCDQSITTTTNEKTKSSSSSSSRSTKTGTSSKGATTTSRSSRISSTSNKSSQGNSINSNKKSGSSSKESSNSSSSSEKKGHMMQKRSMTKPDKKKTSK